MSEFARSNDLPIALNSWSKAAQRFSVSFSLTAPPNMGLEGRAGSAAAPGTLAFTSAARSATNWL